MFLHWADAEGNVLTTNATYAFTVTGESHLRAIYRPTYALSFGAAVTGTAAGEDPGCGFTVTLDPAISGTYGDLTFTDGVATVTLRSGQTVSVTGLLTTVSASIQAAAPAGCNFVSWTDDGEPYSLSDVLYYSVYDSGATMIANFRKTHSVTVTGNGHGTAYANASTGYEGEEILLTAEPAEGYLLQGWQVVSGNAAVRSTYLAFSDGTAYWEHAFNLPANDVEIMAVFAQPYAINTDYCEA